MAYQLGIDFGTTYTSAAVAHDGLVEVVNLGTRSAVVPSVVLVRADGTMMVGGAAEARATTEPNRVGREFKRRLGDPTPLYLGGTPFSAEALIGAVLSFVYQRVVERMGEAPTRTVITHPAAYSQYRLDLLLDAARRANITAEFVPEPEAAAIFYASQARVGDGEVIAVFDLGGGTFDTALLRRGGDRFTLLGVPQGLERLGGIDFDDAIVGFVNDQLGGALESTGDGNDLDTLIRFSRLRADARAAKEALSEDTDATVSVVLPAGVQDITVTRSQFESMIRPRLVEAIQALDRAVASAGISIDGVSKIVLVGGSSRIPLVRQMVANATGRPLAVDIDPEHAVSMGAALAASGRPLVNMPGDGGAIGPAGPPGVAHGAAARAFAAPAPVRAQPQNGPTVSGPSTPTHVPAGPPMQPPVAHVSGSPAGPPSQGPGGWTGAAQPYQTPPAKPRRTGLIITAAVALVAMIAVVIVVVARNSATTAAPTTTEPEVITEPDTSAETSTETSTEASTDTTNETTTPATEPASAVTETTEPSTTEPVTVAPTEAVTAPPVTDAPTEPPTVAPTDPLLSPIDATVVNTCGRSGNGDCFVTVRQAPTAASGEIVRLDEGTPVQVECQTTGQSVNSSVLGRSSTVWVRLVGGGFAAAVFIDAPALDPFSINLRAC